MCIDMYLKVGMTTRVIGRFAGSHDDIPMSDVHDFIGGGDQSEGTRTRCYMRRDLDESHHIDGMTFVGLNVVLGLTR
jgi:hypothetical protein